MSLPAATPEMDRPVHAQLPPAPPSGSDPAPQRPLRRKRTRGSLFANGEPMIWLTGGALVLSICMIVGLLGLILWFGLPTFWPVPVTQYKTQSGGIFMGELARSENYKAAPGDIKALVGQAAEDARLHMKDNDGHVERLLVRTGNFRLTQNHFNWINSIEVAQSTEPRWALVIEPMEWGRVYAMPEHFLLIDPVPTRHLGKVIALDERMRLARQKIQNFKPARGGRPMLLIEPSADNARLPLLPVDQLEKAAGLVGVAEVIDGPEKSWELFGEFHDQARKQWEARVAIEKYESGGVKHAQEEARLAMRRTELAMQAAATRYGAESQQFIQARQTFEAASAAHQAKAAWAEEQFKDIRRRIQEINEANGRLGLLLRTAGEAANPPKYSLMRLDDIVRAYPANQLTLTEKTSIYLSRWWEFLSENPREANSEGGVFPAIFGTVVMTLIMSLLVAPLGVLAALYLREYAKGGFIVSMVRIAVNNLAGVPSIVFGVFGLGFFCYLVGASIDDLFFQATLPSPTLGKGGLMWASITLALMTLPVVIVSTEEALAAVPGSMREGSYACGASKWQTIRRIVLPRAMPGIMTGMILAMARGAGEVAPLMLVGAVKLAPELPIDGMAPFLHPERSFMHLGFHIYDVGFQSQNSEAAKPMVYTTTLLLIGLITILNLASIWLRTRLRKRFVANQF